MDLTSSDVLDGRDTRVDTSGDEIGQVDALTAALASKVTGPALDPALNVRLSAELHTLLVEASGRDGMRKSVWAREVLTAVLGSKLSLAEVVTALGRQARRPAPQVFTEAGAVVAGRLGRSVVAPSACLHPLHLRETFETFDRCACGKTFDLPSPAGGEAAPYTGEGAGRTGIPGPA